MFQFPGFALQTLCIQVRSTWFSPILTTKGNNIELSGGLPHSEIHGSKLILSSPWLIAEYHVLHRLLLPRHPPNALLALDLIQKKQGFLGSKASLSRPFGWFVRRNFCHPEGRRVSVLDLDSIMPAGRTRDARRTAGISMKLMCISLNDVNSSKTGWQSH